MRRLVGLTLVLFILFSIITTSAVVIGWSQPTPQRLTMLHLSDCAAPCWIGIQPGVTYLDKAKAQLEQVYSAASGYSITYRLLGVSELEAKVISNADPLFNVIINMDTFDDSHAIPLRTITFDFSESAHEAFRLSELIALFGHPARVFVGNQQLTDYPVLMKYGNDNNQGSIIVTATQDRLDLSGQLLLLRFFDAGGDSASQTSMWHDAWRGFASLEKYQVR